MILPYFFSRWIGFSVGAKTNSGEKTMTKKYNEDDEGVAGSKNN